MTNFREKLSDFYYRNFASPSLPLLSYALPVFRAELEELIAKRKAQEGYLFKNQWDQVATRLLDESTQAFHRRNADLGWRCLKAADRHMLYGLDESTLRIRARNVLTEAIAEEKGVPEWRKRNIEELLQDIDSVDENGRPMPLKAENVFNAKLLLDEHQDNVYARIAILKSRLLVLTLIGVVLLVLWIFLDPPVPNDLISDQPFTTASEVEAESSTLSSTESQSISVTNVQNVRSSRIFWLLIILAGVLGALISAFTSSMGTEPKKSRIPGELTSSTLLSARIMLGALSAIAVALFLLAGFLNFSQLNYQMVVAVAVVSGITDRLLLATIERTLG